GGDFPKTPGFIGSDPNWNPAAGTDDTAYTNSVARVFTRGRGKSLVSPRIRAAYAFSSNTRVRAAYGQQVEVPRSSICSRTRIATCPLRTPPTYSGGTSTMRSRS